ncbi:hypothetical protein EDD11_006936 [Mortierella claussenii]|nr:hypothetical protein EDD11_006936 [Mortierella claussenii]
MTSATPGAWSGLFHGLPNDTPASRLYTEEAIQNEQLTSDQLIDKAQSSASLLSEMVAAVNEERESLESFEENDVIKALFQECHEMAEYLSERIWDDSGDSAARYHIFDNSSSRSQPKTADEEAQIAAFLSCNEQIQSALRRYRECKDFLSAKAIQEEENLHEHAYTSTHPIGDGLSSLRVPEHRIDGSSTYAAAAAALGDYRAGNDYADDTYENSADEGHTLGQSHLRRSEQPLVWKLDPREDFKAGQSKIKKGMSMEERQRISRERGLERLAERHQLNGVHGITEDPLKIRPEMLTLDDATMDDDLLEESVVALEGDALKARATIPASEGDEDRLERINNRLTDEAEDEQEHTQNPSKDAEGDADKGVLSDDSWEEIPEQGVLSLSIADDEETGQEDITSNVSSSTSSFLITPTEATSRVPSPPLVNVREP